MGLNAAAPTLQWSLVSVLKRERTSEGGRRVILMARRTSLSVLNNHDPGLMGCFFKKDETMHELWMNWNLHMSLGGSPTHQPCLFPSRVIPNLD